MYKVITYQHQLSMVTDANRFLPAYVSIKSNDVCTTTDENRGKHLHYTIFTHKYKSTLYLWQPDVTEYRRVSRDFSNLNLFLNNVHSQHSEILINVVKSNEIF